MKVIHSKILFFTFLFFAGSMNARAGWQIVGDTVTLETPLVLEQNPDNSAEFVYTGKLTVHLFKISDGSKEYIHECGDNDPLGDSIPLRESGEDERGLRIRYAGRQDYFKVTLSTVAGEAKSIEAQRVEIPKNMYMMGGPLSCSASGWNLQDALELEADKENPYIFYYKGDIRYNNLGDEGGSFKILQGKSWSQNWHPEVSGNVALAQAVGRPMKMRLGGEDNKWTIPADRTGDGYYEIKIDLLNSTILVEKFEYDRVDNPYPLAVFVAGDAMSCGWPTDNVTPLRLKRVEDGVYEWEGIVSEGQFKFTQKRGTWMRCYVSTVRDRAVFAGREYDVVFEENYMTGGGNDYKFVITKAGQSKFRLNLKTMKLTVEGQPSTAVETAPDGSGIGFFTGGGKLFLTSDRTDRLRAQVFGVDGKKITEKTFTGSTDIALPKACYLVLLRGESGEKITDLQIFID